MRLQPALVAVSVLFAAQAIASDDLAAVHEWGTFTSVAGEDGAAIGWQTLSGPSDLPCFVHHLDQRDVKAIGFATVRMETPVLYFYPLKPLTVSVHVDFPNGHVTEWYPQASNAQLSTSRRGWIEWNNVHISNASAALPQRGETSHYYAARETDSWPLQSEGENEKLLFYRGIGDFSVDLRPVVDQDGVSLRNEGVDTIPEAIVFQNHAGKIGYHIIRGLREPVSVNYSDLRGSLDDLRTDLEAELTEMGLYHKEALAMVETWRDSWIEEGLRVFYILPRSKVDAVLPISIQPAASQLARVFVGRVELLSPAMRQQVTAALANGDLAVLKKYGRFLDAFRREMSTPGGDLPVSQRAQEFLDSSYNQAFIESHKKIVCTQ